jgi:hypothetical protein
VKKFVWLLEWSRTSVFLVKAIFCLSCVCKLCKEREKGRARQLSVVEKFKVRKIFNFSNHARFLSPWRPINPPLLTFQQLPIPLHLIFTKKNIVRRWSTITPFAQHSFGSQRKLSRAERGEKFFNYSNQQAKWVRLVYRFDATPSGNSDDSFRCNNNRREGIYLACMCSLLTLLRSIPPRSLLSLSLSLIH